MERGALIFLMIFFWIFGLPFSISVFHDQSYLRLNLPWNLKLLVTAIFLTTASLLTFVLIWLGSRSSIGRLLSTLCFFCLIVQAMFSTLYVGSTGKRLSMSELLLLKRDSGFMFWYFVQNETHVLAGLLLICIAAGWLARLTCKFIETQAGRTWIPLGIKSSVAGLGLSLAMLGLACWQNHEAISPTRFYEGASFAEWSWRALKGLAPSLEWTEYAIPPSWVNPLMPSYHGEPLVSPELYRRKEAKHVPPALRSIVVVQLESVRFDVIHKTIGGVPIAPFLSALANQGLYFTRAYANSSHTNYAALCAPLGTYPLRSRFPFLYRKEDPQPHVMLHELLKKFGYRTLFLSSQYEEWGGMDAYWKTDSMDHFLDSSDFARTEAGGWLDFFRMRRRFAGNVDDSITVGKFLGFLKTSRLNDEPFLAFVFLENGHFPYPLPGDYKGPFQPATFDFPASYLDFPREKASILRNAYWNAVSYMDCQMRRLYQGLNDSGIAEDTILVVLGDHGEDLFDSGFPTHGRNLADSVLHIPLIIQDKKRSATTINVPTSQVDVAPTLLGMLGLNSFPGHQGLNVLDDSSDLLSNRPIFFHSNGFGQHDAILLWPWKLSMDVETGETHLYQLEWGELQGGEQRQNYPAIVDRLTRCLLQFRKGQLSYYSHEELYKSYFPPRPTLVDRLLMPIM